MFDPRKRLNRNLPGARQLKARPVVRRLAKREAWETKEVSTRINIRPERFDTRTISRVARLEPNAPQLHRLAIQKAILYRTSPVRVDDGRTNRLSIRQTGEVLFSLEREPTKIPRLTKPTDLHLRPCPRIRPNADMFLQGREKQK